MSKRIDLNCDMGESFGVWTLGQDEQMMAFISSANIACGFHAGDPSVMRETVSLARTHNVAIGAHPGLPDLAGFGRRQMQISPQQAYDLVLVQIGALQAVAYSQQTSLHHVKAHGALYNMAARDLELAKAIACAVADVDNRLFLYALAGSVQVQAGLDAGLQVLQEVFADRAYQADGSLVARTHPQAMITRKEASLEQVLSLVQEQRVRTLDGGWVHLQADTLCLHGDQPGAVEFAQYLRTGLQQEGVLVGRP